MIKIESKDNAKIKNTVKLLKSKYRNQEQKYIIEGVRIINSAIECGIDIDYFICDEDFLKKEDKYDTVKKLEDKKVNGIVTSKKIFSSISETVNSQGIIAVCKMKSVKRDKKQAVVLDRIQDPGNMGTIIRTADAAGFSDVYIVKGSVDIYNPKVIRSAMGSLFSMEYHFGTEEEIFRELKESGYTVVASSLNTDSYYDKVEYPEKTALVIGNEGNGISEYIEKNSDFLVKIPMYGNAESLNASVSSGILIYEIVK